MKNTKNNRKAAVVVITFAPYSASYIDKNNVVWQMIGDDLSWNWYDVYQLQPGDVVLSPYQKVEDGVLYEMVGDDLSWVWVAIAAVKEVKRF